MTFLYEFAIPWLTIWQAIRRNDHDTLNTAWSFALDWFRATNKTLYSTMCVDTCFIMTMMCTPLKVVWNHMRTASMRGNKGRNTAWDHALETYNAEMRDIMPDGADPSQIDAYVEVLNGLQGVRKKFMALLGETPAALGEYTPVKAADVAAIKRVFMTKLGANPLYQNKTNNPFNVRSSHGQTGTPWKRVDDISKTRGNFILNHLENPIANFEGFCGWTSANAVCTCGRTQFCQHCASISSDEQENLGAEE